MRHLGWRNEAAFVWWFFKPVLVVIPLGMLLVLAIWFPLAYMDGFFDEKPEPCVEAKP